MVLQDPRSTSLQDVKSPDQIGYQVLDPEDYRKTLKANYDKLAMKRTPLGIRNVGGYDMFQTQVGLSDKEIAQKAQNQEEFLSTLNTLGLGKEVMQNPEVMQSLYNQYTGYLGSLNRGVMESRGMSPYDKFRMQEALRESRPPVTSLTGTGLPVSGSAVEVPSAFESPSKVQSILRSKDANPFQVERAQAVVDRALTNENVQSLLTPKDIEGIQQQGGLYEYINQELDRLGEGTTKETESSSVISAGAGVDTRTRPEEKEVRRLKELENKLNKAVEYDLEEQSFDFYGNMYDLNPLETSTNKIKAFISNRPLEGFEILTGDLADIKNEKKLKKQDEYELLQEGMEPVGYGYDTTHGTVWRVKDKEGNSYLIRPRDQALANTMVSLTNNEAIGRLEAYHDVDFEGDTMKRGAFTEKLPFKVTSKVEKGPDGKKRRYYTIPSLTYRTFYDKIFNQEYNSLLEQGHSPEEAKEYLTRLYKDTIQGLDERDLDKPYKTAAKASVINALDFYE